MAGETEKKARTVASRKFTRLYNRFNEAISSKLDEDLVVEKFDALKIAWETVQSQHDDYLLTVYPDDEDGTGSEQENKWLENIEYRFETATKTKHDYLKAKQAAKELEKMTGKSEQEEKELKTLSLERDSLLLVFLQESKNIKADIKRDKKGILKNQITGNVKHLKGHLDKCREAHLRYISQSFSTMTPGEENVWIEKVQVQYDDCNDQVFTYLEMIDELETKKKNKIVTKMENVKFPVFYGDIREYAKFKSDFQTQVASCTEPERLSYVLRTCLKEEAGKLVENIDLVDEIWERLDERYGNSSMLVDVIMNDIKAIGSVSDDDAEKSIELVNVVEKGFTDLKRRNLEKEMSNSITVSLLEARLPPLMRREWSKLVNCGGSKVDPFNKFPFLLTFLKEQRKILEYETASIRSFDNHNNSSEHVLVNNASQVSEAARPQKCLIHNNESHTLQDCREYNGKSHQERLQFVNSYPACWCCLIPGHRAFECTNKKECPVDGCARNHHLSLHEPLSLRYAQVAIAKTENIKNKGKTLLPLMKIKSNNGFLSSLWDSCATLSLITFKKAEELGLNGVDCKLSVSKVGGQIDIIESREYILPIIDRNNEIVRVHVYGIETITKGSEKVDISAVVHLFEGVKKEEIERASEGVHVLIGMDYARLQPSKTQEYESHNLVLYENRFGRCIAGSHPLIKQTHQLVVVDAQVHQFDATSFFEIEGMGVQCFPKCGNCSCKKCSLGSKGLSIKEEREQNMIHEGLVYNEKKKRFDASYPWIKPPENLPESYNLAKGSLQSKERRLTKDETYALLYSEQFIDLLARGAARILTVDELKSYKGPVYYLTHHGVLKEGSTTLCRLVFNSSLKINGECLNDYWGTGSNQVNNLLGVLIRFRERPIVIIGDIKKMYHAIGLSIRDQHVHRFLWRNMETHRDPDIYAMQVVSFGDKPAGNIALAALKKTAQMGQASFPRAAETILMNSYVDDLIDSFDDEATAQRTIKEIDSILAVGGFKIKEWVVGNKYSCAVQDNLESKQMVLGVHWDQIEDVFKFDAKLKVSVGKRSHKREVDLATCLDNPNKLLSKLSKRIFMSVINSIYDPLGLIGPFTVKGKIIMRMLWKEKYDWDDELTMEHVVQIQDFFKELTDISSIKFGRCIKPLNAIGKPVLITFSDASKEAFGACVYIRWHLSDNSFKCYLIASKNRVSPLKVQSIPRLELCAAVIATRLAQFIESELRFEIQERYFFIDSQIVKSMINKESHAFNTFPAVRLGEIHLHTQSSEWFWIERKHNIADWITKGKVPMMLTENSEWQHGPKFLYEAEEFWPIHCTTTNEPLPEEIGVACLAITSVNETVGNTIQINRFSKYNRLINTTSRVISMFKFEPKPSFFNGVCLNATYLAEAEILWIKDAQLHMHHDLKQGKYKRLVPIVREDGIVIVQGRTKELFENNYDSSDIVLLPHAHRLSRLYAEYIHNKSHLGNRATVCKIRDKFWISKLGKIVSSIRNKCVTCKKLNSELQKQVMAPIPIHRLKPSPAFHNTYIDFFGPFKIRGVVHKRSSGKGFGVIFTCGSSRAVHCDLSPSYNVDGFLQVFRRFTSIRGCPSQVWSDCGTQLVATDKEFRQMIQGFDRKRLIEFGAEKGIKWHFSPPDAPWYNGCVESLVKSVKRALKVSIGEQILNFPEMQCVLFEAANLVNERPIGVLSLDISDGKYICPNNLLLGRASSRIPAGPFNEDFSPKRRFYYIQRLINDFWKIWHRDFFPSLLVHPKWHTEKRNMRIGDVVLIRDINAVRGCWQMGKVAQIHPSKDKIVRHVDIKYKIPTSAKFKTVKRAVQSLITLLPVEDDNAIV